MLSPSDFNNAVPQFTNGDYASNPINPQYIAEPDAVDYNRGTEPLQTLPAQWWNWFLNKFTNRFNKVNIYVKNIFNELTQLLSLVSETPSGTEGTPTTGQLKCMFETKYPDYLKTTAALSNTYVPQTTKVNGHALSGNITITCVACAGANGSGTAFGTAATVNTGTAVGCIPTVGTALGTTDGQFLATDATGKLKPSGYCASSFRSSSWTPTLVACATCGSCNGTYKAFGTNAFNSTAFTTCTGTVTQVKIGTTAYNPTSGVISLPAYPTTPTTVTNANNICTTTVTASIDRNLLLGEITYTGTSCAGVYVGNSCKVTFNTANGVLKAKCFCGTAQCAANADNADYADYAENANYATIACRVVVYANAWCIHTCSGQLPQSIKNRCSFDILALPANSTNCCTAIPSLFIPAGKVVCVSTFQQWMATPVSSFYSFSGIRIG